MFSFAIIALYLTRSYSLPLAARMLDVGEVPSRTDYVIPLSGDPDTRPFVAAALYKTGLASRVLISRVAQAPEQANGPWPAPHQTTKQILERCGVPVEKIQVLELPHHNTFEEAVAVKHFLEGHANSSVTVVTNGFHTRRARWVFAKVLGPKATNIHFVSAPCDGFDESNWWRVDDGFTTYTTEYMKLAYYVMRYGSALGWIALFTVSVVIATRRTRRQSRDEQPVRKSFRVAGESAFVAEIVCTANAHSSEHATCH